MGLLRFIGLLNAAVWLGAAIFFSIRAYPAGFSADMEKLLGPKNFPYYSGAITHVLMARYFKFELVCAAIGLLHLLAERLYLGKSPQKWWLSILVTLCLLSLFGSITIQPKLQRLNATQYSPQVTGDTRQAASRSYLLWKQLFHATNLLTLGGLGFYFWRLANPPDSARFSRATDFRG